MQYHVRVRTRKKFVGVRVDSQLASSLPCLRVLGLSYIRVLVDVRVRVLVHCIPVF
jgi:hypothetical protein